MHTIDRDPFARADLTKDGPHKRSCQWCGNHDGKGNTYIYRWVPDSLYIHLPTQGQDRTYFCSKSCWKSYTQ